MIKTSFARRNGRRVAVVGLSTKDLELLRDGKSFAIPLVRLGIDADLIVTSATSDREIVDALKRAGVEVPS